MIPTSEHLLAKKKRAKELSMARTTVCSYVASIMPQIGLPYLLMGYENGVVLKIKMQHRRSLQIRLNRQNYIKTIQKLLPAIKTLVNAFDEIGQINVRIVGCHYAEQWTEPETNETEY
ncbi:MAG: hypothetical protein HUK03_09510 [Bacteroidaceae bacterium]|nr:hypothetical protein [Bacteroidaceae bacterium]